MSPEELAAIRERDADALCACCDDADDVRALLAHIDAITEAVEVMKATVTFNRCWDDHEGPDGGHADGSKCPDEERPPNTSVDRAAVLALLRGKA